MMKNDRREFIRKAGMGLLAGMGAASGLLTGGGFERTTSAAWAAVPGEQGLRWGMLFDTRRCLRAAPSALSRAIIPIMCLTLPA